MNGSQKIYRHRINQIIDYINSNLDKSFSLDELAKRSHFSSFHFHRIFLAVTGESVHFFTNRLRLEKAARLIKASSMSLAAVSLECGFSSPSTFSRSFKNYFSISPSTYKKSGQIENSKICKELFPMNEYLVPMSSEELKKNFPVEIKEFPQRRIAYLRIVNAYKEGLVLAAYKVMINWSKKNNLFESQEIFGMSIDDPMTTPKEKYRYEVCITLPSEFEMQDDSEIESMILPKCNYAVTKVSGDIKRVATATHYLFGDWLLNSSYEPEHQHGIELFLDKEKICDWSHFELALCIPIKKLKSY